MSPCINIVSEQKKLSFERVMALLPFYLQPLLHPNQVKNSHRKRNTTIRIVRKIVIQSSMKTFKWTRILPKYFKLQKVKKVNRKKGNVIWSKNKNKYKNNSRLKKTQKKTMTKILLIILVRYSNQVSRSVNLVIKYQKFQTFNMTQKIRKSILVN